MTAENRAWKSFEKLVHKIQSNLSPKATVKLDDKLPGADSRELRQIDISVREKVGQFDVLIVIECKDHPISLERMDGFVQKVRDVRANKGAVVSKNGFSKGAAQLAKDAGIDTFILLDAESKDWSHYCVLPALLTRYRLSTMEIGVKSGAVPAENPDVFDASMQSVGLLRDVVRKKWNDREISEEPGRHVIELPRAGHIEGGHGELIPVDEVVVAVMVERTRYYGPWNMTKGRGLADTQGGSLMITGELEMEGLTPWKIEQGKVEGWSELTDEQDLAITPSIKLSYRDRYTTTA